MKTSDNIGYFNKLVFTFFIVALVFAAERTAFAETSNRIIPGEELLDPNTAFHAQIRQRDANTAELKFAIVPGYYLYRDQLRVEQTTSAKDAKKPAKTSKKASLTRVNNLALSKPEGIPVDDPTFGKVDIYDKPTTVLIDLSRQDKTKDADITLAVVSQGCAAAGVCFPPQRQIFTFKYRPYALIAGDWVNASAAGQVSFSQLGQSATGAKGMSDFATSPGTAPRISPRLSTSHGTTVAPK